MHIECGLACLVVPLVCESVILYQCTYGYCRNLCGCLQNGEVTGGVIELETQAVGLARVGRNVVVATMDKTIHSFHVKVCACA